MSWFIIVIVGALVGWLTSIVMRTESEQGTTGNIIIGVIGAVLGRWLLTATFGTPDATASYELGLTGVTWGIIGALALIWVSRATRVFR